MTSNKANNAATESTKGKKKYLWVDNVRFGQALSLDFFKRNAWLMLVILVAAISLIGLRYKTKTKMSEIKRLQIELEHAKSEKLKEKAEYMTLIRESEMKRLVNEKGLGLEFREQPPYELSVSDVNAN